jgi:hypothetical protein
VNPSFVLQVGLATAMVVGAVATVAVLLRQASIRRRSGLPVASNRERGSTLRPAFGSEATAVKPAKLDESVLAVVKPMNLALHGLNDRVAELHARVDVSAKLLTKLAEPPRRAPPSAQERERADTQEKERAAINAKMGELAQQLRALTNELSTLKRAIETPKKSVAKSTAERPEARSPAEKPEARSSAEKPGARSPAEKPEAKSPAKKPEARSTVEKLSTVLPADTQKLAALLRVMTAESLPHPDRRQAPSANSGTPPVCAVNPYPVVRPAEGGSASPEKSASELKAKLLRLLPKA